MNNAPHDWCDLCARDVDDEPGDLATWNDVSTRDYLLGWAVFGVMFLALVAGYRLARRWAR